MVTTWVILISSGNHSTPPPTAQDILFHKLISFLPLSMLPKIISLTLVVLDYYYEGNNEFGKILKSYTHNLRNQKHLQILSRPDCPIR